VSHSKERGEKVCLNCNAAIYGRFCHVCGQENLEPKESFGHLVTHFLFDLLHFDGKFFSTLKYLLFKPGFLAEEHARGRRADYLHPIRLYIFVSAFFFLIMFSFYSSHKSTQKTYKQKVALINGFLNSENKKLSQSKNSNDISVINNSIKKYKSKLEILKIDSDYNNLNVETEFALQGISENSGGIIGKFKKAIIIFGKNDEQKEKLIESFFHAIPKALFIVLPFYALILLIIYIRNKGNHYVNHLLFSIYLFSFTLILVLCTTWLNSLLEVFKIHITDLLTTISLGCAMLYTYKGLRNFYKQSRLKTFFKFSILSICCLLLAFLAMVIAFSLSALTI
jgi:hypothetical protein